MTQTTADGRTAHTKGPWSVYHFGDTLSVCIGELANGRRPCIVDWPGFDSCDLPILQKVANAHLIAAAPDLVKALEEIGASVTSMELPAFAREETDFELAYDTLIGIARAALAAKDGR